MSDAKQEVIKEELFMTEKVAVGVFEADEDARDVVTTLKEAGIKDEYLSFAAPAGKIQPLEKQVQGFHTTSHRIREGARWGGWVGGIAGILAGAGVFFVALPAGAVVAVGTLAGIIAGAIEGAVVGAGVGILATALVSMGIKEPEARELERRVAAGEFLVVIKGPEEVVNRAEAILKTSNPLAVMAA